MFIAVFEFILGFMLMGVFSLILPSIPKAICSIRKIDFSYPNVCSRTIVLSSLIYIGAFCYHVNTGHSVRTEEFYKYAGILLVLSLFSTLLFSLLYLKRPKPIN